MEFLAILLGYVAILVFCTALIPKTKWSPSATMLYVILLAAFVLFVYFRPLYFRDTTAYISFYESAKWEYMNGFNLMGKSSDIAVEYGYLLLMLIFKALGFSVRGFFAVIALISVASLYYGAGFFCEYLSGEKIERKYFILFLAIYLSYFGIFYNFVAIRSGLSFSFIMLAAVFVAKRRYLYGIILFIVAVSLQRLSLLALIPLLCLLFLKINLKRKTFLVIWILLGILLLAENESHILIKTVGVSLENIWNSIVSTPIYINIDQEVDSGLTKLMLYFGYWLNGIVYYYNYEEDHKYQKFSFIYLVTLVIGLIVNGYSASYRIVDYLYLFSLPMNFYCFVNWKRSREMRIVFFLIVMFVPLFMWGKSFLYWYLYD